MAPSLLAASLSALGLVVYAKNDGLARHPSAGWNTWNYEVNTGCDAQPNACLTEELMLQMADALVDTGMAGVGYDIVNLSEGWPATERAPNGSLIGDPVKFPHGIPWLSEQIRGKGLKFGIYLDAGLKTCAGYPGSLGHELGDIAMIASWNVSYLWLDGCNIPSSSPALEQALYANWSTWLNASGQPIIFQASIAAYNPTTTPIPFMNAISHEYRFFEDIRPSWSVLMEILNYTLNVQRVDVWSRPGQHPFMDMLTVGNGNLTTSESRAHFSVWCMMAQPLHAGNDLRSMSADVRDILTNSEAIAIDRDPLCKAASAVKNVTTVESHGVVLSRLLSDASVAILLLNEGEEPLPMCVTWDEVGLDALQGAAVRDVWRHADLGWLQPGYCATVPPHDVSMVRVQQ